jgi:hypothetical protein
MPPKFSFHAAVLVVYFVGVWVWDVSFPLFSCVIFILVPLSEIFLLLLLFIEASYEFS